MSSSKEPPVDQRPIPFGNQAHQGNSRQQGFFGVGQSQQTYSAPTGSNVSSSSNNNNNNQYLGNRQQQSMADNFHSNQVATQGTHSQGQQPSNGVSNQSSYYDNNQYQNTQIGLQPQKSNVQLNQQQQQYGQMPQYQQGATLTQAYNPPFYNQQYAESVVSDISYQQHYQNYDQNPQYQQQYYQSYDSSQQQNNYNQSQQHNYSQQQYAYNQQQYNYSQQQQYGYTQQDQYNYAQQQEQKNDANQQQQQQQNQERDISQQPEQQDTSNQQNHEADNQQQIGTTQQHQYDVNQQQKYDVNQQQQQFDDNQQQQYDTSQQQQYDASQQQKYDVNQQQQQFDDNQQQQYDASQQQQYDTSQQQQYDASQQQQYDASQQQQYDASQQQQYDASQQQQYDVNQQQQYDVNQQQQYDVNQQQQYDANQQQQYDANQQQYINELDTKATPDTNKTDEWNQWNQQQAINTEQQLNNYQEAVKQEVSENQNNDSGNTKQDSTEIKAHNNQQNSQVFSDQESYQNVELQHYEQHEYSSGINQSEDKESILNVDQYNSKVNNQHTEVLNQPTDQQVPQEQSSINVQNVINQPDQVINGQQQQQPQIPLYGSPSLNSEAHSHLGVLPPSVVARINSPQPATVTLVPCPDPNCEGENKPKAKFCSECGRPLASLSRASTPMVPFSPQTHSYSPSQYQSQTWYGNQYGYNDQSLQYQQHLGSVAPPDPLQRNKGYPLLTFGFGGKLCITFPKKSPSKISPSGVQLKDVKELSLPNVQHLSDFIGSTIMNTSVDLDTKKQTAVTYMNSRIEEFYNSLQSLQQYSNEYYQLENKVLLWQLVKILIEIEGYISDSGNIDNALYTLLYPIQSDDAQLNKNDIDIIRDYLLQGDRDNAIQYAIQQNLWTHAFIIAKFVDQEIWKSVVENFVEQTLTNSTNSEGNSFYQTVYQDSPSLRVLYSLISGNSINSVSHFLPKHSDYPIDTALTKWRETLVLLLVNRNEHTDYAINKLGNLLNENNWKDAADICYIISSVSNLRTNDESADSHLLGSQEGDDATTSLDSLYLTELYEFGISLNQYYNTSILPFLQSYKLVHAWWLVDAGYTSEANYYLESIISGVTSYNRSSNYLHQELLESLKELADRLSGSSDNSNLSSSLQLLENTITNGFDNSGVTLEHNETTTLANAPIHIEENNDNNAITNVGEVLSQNQLYSNETEIPSQNQPVSYDAEVPSQNQSNSYETEVLSQNQPINYEAEVPSYNQPVSYGNEVSTAISYDHSETIIENSYVANTKESANIETPTANDQSVSQNINNQFTEEYSSQYHTDVHKSVINSQENEVKSTEQPVIQHQLEITDNKKIEQYNHSNETGYSVETNQQTYSNYNSTPYENQPATLYTNDYTTTPSYENQSAINYTTTEEKNNTPYDTQPATFDAVTEEYTTTTYEAEATTAAVNDNNQEYISTYEHHSTDYSATNNYNSPYDIQTPLEPHESNQEVPSYDHVSKENELKSNPPSYEPSQTVAEPNNTAWDENDDSLGLGNSSSKKSQGKEVKDDVDTTSTDQSKAEQTKDGNDDGDDDDDESKQDDRKGWGFLSMFSRASPATVNDKDEKKAVKANLGEQSSFYYDEKEGRWVNKNGDSPAAPAKPPPPPKAGLKPTSAPEASSNPPPSNPPTIDSINKSPNLTSAPPSLNSPMLQKATTPTPASLDSNSTLQDLMNAPPPPSGSRRAAAGKKKPMRSRYVDVFNTPPPS